MPHNPYWNAQNGYPKWTAEEDAAIEAFRSQGLRPVEIHMKMPQRTTSAIKLRLSILRIGLDKHRQRDRTRRPRVQFPKNHVAECVVPVVVPDEVMAERESRLSAPRSLTALICGDPPVGFSALERRS
jgi:hypothetical protein